MTTAITDSPVQFLLTPMTEHRNPRTESAAMPIRRKEELVGLVNSKTRNPYTAQDTIKERMLSFLDISPPDTWIKDRYPIIT